ncbi:hypothetical protein ACIA6C_15980 [Streptomyces sp. NPDC051578]|uniref:hypothetical protein n=1 Tax=Streptomyces sp. NPDC051578 TaxID=3365662 RepID=UPI0037A05CD8
MLLQTRGGALVQDAFPDLAAAGQLPAGLVLNGEVLAWDVEAGAPVAVDISDMLGVVLGEGLAFPGPGLLERERRRGIPIDLVGPSPA